MKKEEKFIRNLRGLRRRQIIASLICILAFGACLGFLMWLRGEHETMVSPESISRMLPPDASADQLPRVLSVLQRFARSDAELASDIKLFSILIGAMIGLLIVATFDLTHRRVILSMWDRIQDLEQKLKDKEGQQSHPEATSETAPSAASEASDA